MDWKIKYTYTTGDTFGTEEGVEGEFDHIWKNKSAAQETLKRMKEHYLWRNSHLTAYGEDLHRPKWFVLKGKDNENEYFNGIDDYGNDIYLSTMEYLGCFERLEGACVDEFDKDRDKNSFTIGW